MTDVIIRTNLPDLSRQLKAVNVRMQNRYVRRSLTAAGAVLRTIARSKAPELQPPKDRRAARKDRIHGALRRAIVLARSRRRSGRGVEVYNLGVRSKVKIRGRSADPFYWRWIEAGWMPRGAGQRLRGGERFRRLQRERNAAAGARRVPGAWFLRDAARQGQQKALDAFYRRMDESFAAESKR